MNISRSSFQFVPYLDYNIKWTDKDLFEYFGLESKEIELVSNIIRVFDE